MLKSVFSLKTLTYVGWWQIKQGCHNEIAFWMKAKTDNIILSKLILQIFEKKAIPNIDSFNEKYYHLNVILQKEINSFHGFTVIAWLYWSILRKIGNCHLLEIDDYKDTDRYFFWVTKFWF